MAGPQTPRGARRRALYVAAAITAVAVVVGAWVAVQAVAQSSRLIWSQRLRVNLRLMQPGAPADLKRLSRMGPHRVTVRQGARPGERTEVWNFGPARVHIRFAPGRTEGLVIRIEGGPPAMAWPSGRGPGEAGGNLQPGSVVPIAVACRPARH